MSEWRSSVHHLGSRCCSAEVQKRPQPEDHPCRQPGSAVLWKCQSGVPVTSVCQPQNHCALWVKIVLKIVHDAEALAGLAAMDNLGYGYEAKESKMSLTSKTNSFAVPAKLLVLISWMKLMVVMAAAHIYVCLQSSINACSFIAAALIQLNCFNAQSWGGKAHTLCDSNAHG